MPGIPIVAEESDPSTFQGFERSSAALFVDPVDGTRDFIAKNGEFCVMIGLAEEGRATVGVVLCPTFAGSRRTYGAAEGIGSFLIGEDDSRTPLTLSNVTDLSRVRCAVSRFHRSRRRRRRSSRRSAARSSSRSAAPGSRACVVASGELDLYAHPSRGKVKLWDACAPDAIVRAAGGVFTDAKGTPFDYRGPVAQGQGTLAANAALHAEALRRFAEHDRRTGGETIA